MLLKSDNKWNEFMSRFRVVLVVNWDCLENERFSYDYYFKLNKIVFSKFIEKLR